ncbi:MAG: Mov34/MPN/PAD-1 family protein, partial [Nitrospirota bacterium]
MYISESAFMDLVLSSAEVYKKECLGILLGYRLEDRFIIEHAFTYQTAKRKPKGVVFQRRRHKKIEEILKKFERLQVLGDFHSHTQFGPMKGIPNPSEVDIRGMQAGKIYLIVVINDNERKIQWKENRDGTLSGTLGRFYYKISAHYLYRRKGLNGKMAKRAKIYCNFSTGMNGA